LGLVNEKRCNGITYKEACFLLIMKNVIILTCEQYENHATRVSIRWFSQRADWKHSHDKDDNYLAYAVNTRNMFLLFL